MELRESFTLEGLHFPHCFKRDVPEVQHTRLHCFIQQVKMLLPRTDKQQSLMQIFVTFVAKLCSSTKAVTLSNHKGPLMLSCSGQSFKKKMQKIAICSTGFKEFPHLGFNIKKVEKN